MNTGCSLLDGLKPEQNSYNRETFVANQEPGSLLYAV
jgi:hypothetical protein